MGLVRAEISEGNRGFGEEGVRKSNAGYRGRSRRKVREARPWQG